MGKHCIVEGCKGENMGLTSFPVRNPELCLKWVNAIKNPVFIGKTIRDLSTMKVCLKHFDSKWTVPKMEQVCKRYVYHGGVPTLYVPEDNIDWNAQLVESKDGDKNIITIQNVVKEKKKDETVAVTTEPEKQPVTPPANTKNEPDFIIDLTTEENENILMDANKEYILNNLEPSVLHNYASLTNKILTMDKTAVVNDPITNILIIDVRTPNTLSVCNICNKPNPVIKNIDEVDLHVLSYRDELKICFPDVNTDVVNLLSLICSPCCAKLRLVYEFRVLYRTAGENLRNLNIVPSKPNVIENPPNSTTSNIKEFSEISHLEDEDNSVEIISETNENLTQEKPTDFQILRDCLNVTNELTCNVCKIKFRNSKSLIYHKRSVHKLKSNVCRICNEIFPSYASLQKHSMCHSKKFLCPQCGKKFTRLKDLRCHEKTHNTQTMKCVKCFKRFKSKKAYLKHNDCMRENQFMCEVCGKIYRAKIALVEHLRTHTGVKPFKCVECDKSFRTRMQLILHKETHNEFNNYVCEECGKSFKTRRTFQVHRKIHTDIRPYVCKYCDRRFLYKKGYLLHTRTHTNERPFVCTYDNCNNDYKDKNQLKKHIISVHIKVKNFKCEIPGCDREFYFSTNKKKHMKRHSEAKNFQCEICKKWYKTKCSLSAHLRQFHTDHLKCVCGESFQDANELTAHREECSVIKNFCPTCDVEFDDEVSMSQHNCADFLFICSNCNAKFRTQKALTEHEKTHIDPIMCTVCNRMLKNQYTLKKHMITHSATKQFSCEFCGKKFRHKVGLKIHRFIHTGERLYSCNLCDKSYRQPGHLYDHKNMHLGIKPHKCDLCTKSYRQKRDLTIHLNKVHGIIKRTIVSADQKNPEEIDPDEVDPEDGDPEEVYLEEGDTEDGDPEKGYPDEGDPEEGDPEEGDPEEDDPEKDDLKADDPKNGPIEIYSEEIYSEYIDAEVYIEDVDTENLQND